MPDYQLGIFSEDSLTLSTPLDGVTGGNGSNMDGATIVFNSYPDVIADVRDNDARFQDNDGGQRLNSALTINGETIAANTVVEAEYRLVLEDSNGNQIEVFAVNFLNSSPAYATIEGLGIFYPDADDLIIGATYTVVDYGETGNSAADFEDNLLVCFCRGTNIATGFGETPVEKLKVGDEILTADNGLQKIKWIGHRVLSAEEITQKPHIAPVRIRRDTLTKGVPREDTWLSPHHRVLVKSKIAKRMFSESQIFIDAKHLTKVRGIARDEKRRGVTYYHIKLNNHEVVFANGMPCESLYLGKQALGKMNKNHLREIFEIFPELSDENYKAEFARKSPSNRDQRQLIDRHISNYKPLIEIR